MCSVIDWWSVQGVVSRDRLKLLANLIRVSGIENGWMEWWIDLSFCGCCLHHFSSLGNGHIKMGYERWLVQGNVIPMCVRERWPFGYQMYWYTWISKLSLDNDGQVHISFHCSHIFNVTTRLFFSTWTSSLSASLQLNILVIWIKLKWKRGTSSGKMEEGGEEDKGRGAEKVVRTKCAMCQRRHQSLVEHQSMLLWPILFSINMLNEGCKEADE